MWVLHRNSSDVWSIWICLSVPDDRCLRFNHQYLILDTSSPDGCRVTDAFQFVAPPAVAPATKLSADGYSSDTLVCQVGTVEVIGGTGITSAVFKWFLSSCGVTEESPHREYHTNYWYLSSVKFLSILILCGFPRKFVHLDCGDSFQNYLDSVEVSFLSKILFWLRRNIHLQEL